VIDTGQFGDQLKSHGFNFFSGVPCSYLTSLINYAVNECELIMAANEGDAIAICAGAQLGGKKSVFLCQNSGLTNAVSPLTSLIYTFRIPILGFVSLRGEPGGKPDEPQHELMGQITTQMLDLMRVKWAFLSSDQDEAAKQLDEANAVIDGGDAFFFVVKNGTFSKVALRQQPGRGSPHTSIVLSRSDDPSIPTRFEALTELARLARKDTVFIATTGFTGRELYESGDVQNNFYMVGSMGCASPLGMGLALARPDIRVIVIDGDGALLMRMGAAAVLAAYAPPNLVHVLLDNNAHDSTGGQKTVSDRTDFVAFAESVGYGNAFYAHDASELASLVLRSLDSRRLGFVYLQIAPGAKADLGRPKTKPPEVRERFMKFISASAGSH
jgi:phosphonopyruvate decarboxylase